MYVTVGMTSGIVEMTSGIVGMTSGIAGIMSVTDAVMVRNDRIAKLIVEDNGLIAKLIATIGKPGALIAVHLIAVIGQGLPITIGVNVAQLVMHVGVAEGRY